MFYFGKLLCLTKDNSCIRITDWIALIYLTEFALSEFPSEFVFSVILYYHHTVD